MSKFHEREIRTVHQVIAAQRWYAAGRPVVMVPLSTGLRHGRHRAMRLVQGGFAKETHIDALPISKRTREALRRMSVWYLEDLAEVTDAELRQQQGVGESTCELLIEMLKTVGLHLREAESFER